MHSVLFSLRTRIILIVAFGFSIFAVAMGYQAVRERQARLEAAESELSNTADLIAVAAAKDIALADALFAHLVSSSELHRPIDAEECQRNFTQVVKQFPEFSNAMFALPDGKVVCIATPLKQAVNIADWPGFKAALASPGVVIGEARNSRVTGKRVLPIYKAVRDGNGEVRGVLHIGLGLSWLNHSLDNSKYLEGARVGLIDPQGQVLARYPDPEHWVGTSAFETSFFKAVVAHGGEGIARDIGFDGVPRVYGLARFLPTRTGPITLWVGYAADSVTAEADSHFRNVLVGTAVLLLLTLAAIWFGVERLILRPVSVLSGIARRLGSGDLSARSGIGVVRNELGALAQSFDDMAETLESKNRDLALAGRALKVLSAWNQTLVESPDERTLSESMCRAIVETGGYRGAITWFAKSDEQKSVEPVTWWGLDGELVAGMKVTWAETVRGRSPAGSAIRLGTTVVMNDIITNPDTLPWHEDAQRHHLNAIVALPLKVDGAVIGALSIYAAESESFGEQEVVLLTEVAAALSSGIAGVRARAAHARLEVSLQTSEDRFRAAADASPDALFVFKSVRDSAGSIVDFEITAMNARAAQQIGIPRDEAIGNTYLGLFPRYLTPSLFDEYAQVATTGNRFESEFPYEVPDKGTRWFRQQAVRVGDGIAISLRDVTAWKSAGDKLRQSEERLRRAMEAAHMGAWQWDLANDRFSSSGSMGALFGMAAEGGPRNSKEFLDAVHPADREALTHAMARDHTTGTARQMEYRVLWPDGSVHWLAANTNVIGDVSGKPVQVAGLLTDITERKEAEIARDRAHRALKTLSAGNEELVRATSESGLLHGVCRVVVETGGYLMASVDYPKDDPEKSIVPMARAQADQSYIGDSVTRTWADTAEGQLPVAQAIRTRKRAIDRYMPDGLSYSAAKARAASPVCISNLALPLLDGAKFIGVLSIRADDLDAFDDAEIQLLEELAADLAFGIAALRTRAERNAIAYEHEHHAEILRRGLEESIQAIAATVEMRDPYTAGHQKRVADVATAIATAMGLEDEKIHAIHLAGVVHDLGKVRVPAEILSKPGKLSAIEYALIKHHPQAGYEILRDISFPWPLARIVWEHHERVDGSGYPRGIKGDEMLLESRIMAVADVVEAMASHRPYRASLGIEPALQEIERGRGTAYDLVVVDACLKLFREEGFVLPE